MEQRIKHLFRKYLSNTCTAEELDEFFHCIRIANHDETLRQILQESYESILNASETYVNVSGDLIIPGSDIPLTLQAPKSRRRHRMAIAALVFMGIGITGCLIYFMNRKQQIITAQPLTGMKKTTTEKAEYKYILLPDSTQVWLNAGSTLLYPDHFDKATREVILSGEAYFDVKHAAEHPFIIHTGQIMTTVLGTAFDINAYADRLNIKVSVSRGKVKVSRGNQLIATLVKDQEVKVSQQENTVVQKVVSTNSVAAWQQGNMVYDDETLGEIIGDLERVYNVRIQIRDSKMRSLQLSTSFRRELGISHALEILCKLTDTQLFEKNGIFLIQ
jgi:ferric-dicitrate binding protein FerR (iron transport regulator)